MADTGFLFPSANSQDAVGAGGAWTNLGNLYSDNATNARAQVRAGESSFTATLSGFTLTGLPDTATIDGIEVQVDSATGAGSGTMTVAPQVTIKGTGTAKTGVTKGRNDAAVLHTLGGAADVWGLSGGNLTGSGLKSGFTLTLRAIGAASGSGQAALDVDYVAVKVYYTTAGGTTGQIKAYVGGSFQAKPVKVWNGSAWVTKPLKRWNGSAWVVTPY